MNSPADTGPNSLDQLLEFLCKLERHKLHFFLEHNRGEALMVLIAVPGERWEVEFFADGDIEVEIFGGGRGLLSGAQAREALDRLFTLPEIDCERHDTWPAGEKAHEP